MRVLRVILIVIIAVCSIASLYFDTNLKPHYVFWILAKPIFPTTMVFFWIFYLIRNKQSANLAFVLVALSCGVWAIFYTYDIFKEYQLKTCQNKFGPEFNSIRKKRGVPGIPDDWQISSGSIGADINWVGSNSIGHFNKYTRVDSTCAIEFEQDEYRFKPVQGIQRGITIKTMFAKGRAKDTITYHWVGGIDINRTITRHEADSIFAAEKIRKDY